MSAYVCRVSSRSERFGKASAMGSIEFDDFPPSHIGAEHSRPIGSFDVEHPITLTRIGRRDGRIVYLEEVRAYLRFEQINKSFQKRQGQKSQPSSHGWCRMAIRVPKADRTVFAGESLVTGNSGTYQLTTSRWPYSSGFAFWTPFRNEIQKAGRRLRSVFPRLLRPETNLSRHWNASPLIMWKPINM